MVIFGIILELSDQNIYQDAPNRTILQNFLGGTCPQFPKHLCNAQHAVSRHAYIYTSGKIICTPLLNPVMYAHLSLFGNKMTIIKGPLFPIFKWSTSIHENNPALVVSIVLQKHYFHDICTFSKKTVNFTGSCAFAEKV